MTEDSIFDELENNSEEPSIGQDYEEWWDPNKMPDQLMGVIVEVHSAPEKFTDAGDMPDPVYTLVSVGRGGFEAGEARCLKTHVQLLSGLEDATLGDLVNVSHNGLVPTDNGNAANSYDVGVIKEETWKESDQADDIEEVIEAYPGATGDNQETEPYSQQGGSSSSSSPDVSGGSSLSDAAEFFEGVIDLQQGEMGVEEAEKMLHDVRDFTDTSVEEVAEELGGEVDGDTVTV